MRANRSTLRDAALVLSFILSLLYFFMAGKSFQIATELKEAAQVLAYINVMVFFLGGLLTFWWALAIYRFCLGGLPASNEQWKQNFSKFIDNATDSYRVLGPAFLMGKGLVIMSALLAVALGASEAHGAAIAAIFVIWIGHTLAQLRVYVESLMLLQPDFMPEWTDVMPPTAIQEHLVDSLGALAAFSFGAACINLMPVKGWTEAPTLQAAVLYAVFGTVNVFALLLWKAVLEPPSQERN